MSICNPAQYDKIIIGAGLYGMYAADFCGNRNQHVLVLEYDDAPFQRATYINQARVHMGYHYPRSLTTAVKSAGYFRRRATKGFRYIRICRGRTGWLRHGAGKRTCCGSQTLVNSNGNNALGT